MELSIEHQIALKLTASLAQGHGAVDCLLDGFRNTSENQMDDVEGAEREDARSDGLLMLPEYFFYITS